MKENLETDTCKKTRIIEAAKELFVKNGYNGTSLRDIAKLSKVHTSLIYHYFENKIDLWKYVKGSFISESNLTCMDYLAKGQIPKEFFRKFIQSRFKVFNEHPELLRMFDWQRLEDVERKLIGTYSDVSPTPWESTINQIKEFQDQGLVTKQYNASHICYMLIGFVMGPYLRLGNNEITNEKDQQQYISMIESFLGLLVLDS